MSFLLLRIPGTSLHVPLPSQGDFSFLLFNRVWFFLAWMKGQVYTHQSETIPYHAFHRVLNFTRQIGEGRGLNPETNTIPESKLERDSEPEVFQDFQSTEATPFPTPPRQDHTILIHIFWRPLEVSDYFSKISLKPNHLNLLIPDIFFVALKRLCSFLPWPVQNGGLEEWKWVFLAQGGTSQRNPFLEQASSIVTRSGDRIAVGLNLYWPLRHNCKACFPF